LVVVGCRLSVVGCSGRTQIGSRGGGRGGGFDTEGERGARMARSGFPSGRTERVAGAGARATATARTTATARANAGVLRLRLRMTTKNEQRQEPIQGSFPLQGQDDGDHRGCGVRGPSRVRCTGSWWVRRMGASRVRGTGSSWVRRIPG